MISFNTHQDDRVVLCLRHLLQVDDTIVIHGICVLIAHADARLSSAISFIDNFIGVDVLFDIADTAFLMSKGRSKAVARYHSKTHPATFSSSPARCATQ